MIITLTPDIEQALTAEAQKRGRTPEQLALDSLRERFLFPETIPSPIWIFDYFYQKYDF